MKLVRDKIPELFPEAGTYGRMAAPDHLTMLLMAKIVEEVAEVFGAASAGAVAEETADVIEALLAYAAQVDVTPEEIDRARAAKREARGGFEQGWVLS